MERIGNLIQRTSRLAQRATKICPSGATTGPKPALPEDLEAVSRAALAELERARRSGAQAALEKALGRAGIPRRFIGRGFDAYEASREEQRRALTLCRQYAAAFPRNRAEGNCLLLVGGPGTGKTHLACAILQAAIRKGYTGFFTSVSEALRTIRDAYSPHAERSEREAFSLYVAPDVLVLDEVGVAIGDGEKRRAMLFDVINARYGEIKPTVLIGNLTVEELEDYLGERIMDRLRESGGVTVPFTWPSYRRRPAGTAGGRDA